MKTKLFEVVVCAALFFAFSLLINVKESKADGSNLPHGCIELAQCGYWTHCWAYYDGKVYVNTAATSPQQCHSLIAQCVGHTVATEFNTSAVLQNCNDVIVLCNK